MSAARRKDYHDIVNALQMDLPVEATVSFDSTGLGRTPDGAIL